MSKHNLYKDSPSIKHEEGHAKVVKSKEQTEGDGQTDEGVKETGMPVHVRHAYERMSMHTRHEHEHHTHDYHHDVSGKEEMHARHESEMKAMHTRHEKEGAHGGKEAGAGGATGEPIEKIEKNAKS